MIWRSERKAAMPSRIASGNTKTRWNQQRLQGACPMTSPMKRTARLDTNATVQAAPSGRHVRGASMGKLVIAARRDAWAWACSAAILYISFRSEEHTSELQSLMRISYAVFCLKKKNSITYDSIQLISI